MCNRIMIIVFGVVVLMFFIGLVTFTYVRLNSRANIDDTRFNDKLTYGEIIKEKLMIILYPNSETPTMKTASMNDFEISVSEAKNDCIIKNCDVKCNGMDANKMMEYFNRFYSDVRLFQITNLYCIN